jgi:uncharacterized protein YlzI (FlbEa/FlbD family)
MVKQAPLLVYLLIILHSIEGHEVTIAPDQITNLRAARPNKPNTLFIEQASCVISLTDGKFVTVKETCAEVRLLIEQQRK